MFENLTDGQLLRAYVAEWAEDAFTALLERHLGLASGTALRRCNDRALAREVTQKVFVILAGRVVWLTSHPRLGGWIHLTTLNLACAEMRGEQRRRQREQVAVQLGTCMKPDAMSGFSEWPCRKSPSRCFSKSRSRIVPRESPRQ